MRALVIIIVVILSCSGRDKKIELLKSDMHDKTFEILGDLSSNMTLKNASVNYDKSRFYYELNETLGKERNKEFTIKEITDTLQSPDAVKIVIDFHQYNHRIGSLMLDYYIEDFRLKDSLLSERIALKEQTGLFETLFEGNYIDVNQVIEIANKNGFESFYSIELSNDNFWKKNTYTEKSKVVWVVKKKLKDHPSFENKIIKIDAKKGKILSTIEQ
ncbi:MAG: hypothetical protein WBG46_08060 [Nonlabens sp.]